MLISDDQKWEATARIFFLFPQQETLANWQFCTKKLHLALPTEATPRCSDFASPSAVALNYWGIKAACRGVHRKKRSPPISTTTFTRGSRVGNNVKYSTSSRERI